MLCISLASFASADSLEPTTEQLSERTRSFGALWSALQENTKGLRIRANEELLTSGEFDGARTWWLRTGVTLEGALPLTDTIILGISPSFGWERLVVDGANDFIIARSGRDTGFTDFYGSGLRLGARIRATDDFEFEFVTGFSSRHERGADYGDAVQAGGSIALSYRRGRWLRLRLGVGIGSDLEDGDLRFSPVYRIQLRPTEQLSFEARGLGGSVDYDWTRQTAFTLEGRIDGTQYALAKRGEPPVNAGDGTLQRRQARVTLEVRHRLTDRVRLRGGVGIIFEEELTVYDEDGIEVDTRQEKDPSLALRLGVELRL